MKTAIIYYSKHHKNTKQLLDAIKNSSTDEITLLDVNENFSYCLDDYDLIGFASGIYYSKFQKKVLNIAKSNTLNGKKVFLIYTCGAEKPNYTKTMREVLNENNAKILGEYGCLGYDTFGPFKLMGGIAKSHPDDNDIKNAISFYENLKK